MSSRQKPSDDWNAHKESIKSLYIEQDVSLDDLVKIMNERGFKATKGQFERRLRSWKMFKNLQEKQWKVVIKKIKIRKAQSLSSDVYFHGRRLPSPKVRKAIQRYDLPKRLSSPSPSPDMMEGIQVSTPLRSPSCTPSLPLSHFNGNDQPLGDDVGLDYVEGPAGSFYLDNLPSVEFRNKLGEFFKPTLQIAVQLSGTQLLDQLLPGLAWHLCPMSAASYQEFLTTDSINTGEVWETLLKDVGSFPVPLRTPNSNSALDIYIWLIEFIVIGSANGLLRAYEDRSLQWLVDSLEKIELMDAFLKLVKDHDFQCVVVRIVHLQTIATKIFAAQALLGCLEIEDERLLELLLALKVPLDGFRKSWDGRDVSAIHLAVEHQNENFVRRLLDAGIDPDGYIKEVETEWNPDPLSRLVELYSIRSAIHVIRISDTVIDLVLEAQRKLYQPDHCASYVGLLTLGVWEAGAADSLVHLQKSYQLPSTQSDSECLPGMTHHMDGDLLASNVLRTLLQCEKLHPPDQLYMRVERKALQERCGSMAGVLLSQWKFNPLYHPLSSLSDSDTAKWLLSLRAYMPRGLSMVLAFAVELDDNDLCRFFTGQILSFMTRANKSKYNELLDPDSILSRAEAVMFSTTLHSKNSMKAAQLISHFMEHGLWSWVNVLGSTLTWMDIGLCHKLFRFFGTFVDQMEQDFVFEGVLEKAVRGEYPGDKLPLILEFSRGLTKPIEWSAFYRANCGAVNFRGDLCVLQALHGAGLPLSKSLLMSCLEGPYPDETVPFLLTRNPELALELTPRDLCHAKLCNGLLKYGQAYMEYEAKVGQGANVTGTLKKLVARYLPQLHDWSFYMAANGDSFCEISKQGVPCSGCTSMRKCLKPVHAAVDLDDMDMLKGLIKDGFNAGQPYYATSCTFEFLPITLAVEERKTDSVAELLRAGADPNAYGFDDNTDFRRSRTALQFAVWSGDVEITCQLLRAGADVNARAALDNSATALELAAINRRLDIVHLMVANNPNVKKLTHECRRAGRCAQLYHEYEIARYLDEQVASLTMRMGRDEVDDGIESLYECQLLRYHWRASRDAPCSQLHPADERSWYASLIYFTNACLHRHERLQLKRELTGEESLHEIKDLLEYKEGYGEAESEEDDSDQSEADELYTSEEDELPETEEDKPHDIEDDTPDGSKEAEFEGEDYL